MTRIEKYGLFCRSYEGGWSNNKSDAGGMTMRGVTMATYEAFRKAKGYSKPTASDLRNITADEWNEVLRWGYWNPIKADKIEDEWIAYLLTDCVWMSGVSYIKKVQQLLSLVPDGIVGPKTLAALNGGDHKAMFGKLWRQRESNLRYIATLRNNKIFLKGWLRRLNAVQHGSLTCDGGRVLL